MSKARAFDAAKYRDNPKLIAKYLNDALGKGDAALITKAIGDMVRAQGVSNFSQKVGLRREGLYRSFRGNMGPGFDTVMKVLHALQIQLVAKPDNRIAEPEMSRSAPNERLIAARASVSAATKLKAKVK
jgi:probable addiction module antidote protein